MIIKLITVASFPQCLQHGIWDTPWVLSAGIMEESSTLAVKVSEAAQAATNSIRDIWNMTATKIFVIVLLTMIASRIIKALFKRIMEKKNQIYIRFLQYFFQAFLWIFSIYLCGNFFESIQSFLTAVLTGSTLLVAVVGFAAQTSLEDLIAGLLISAFQPFQIGDRVHLKNQNLTGIIEDITLRHTVLQNVTTAARTIIPNSVMNKEVLENSEYTDSNHSNLLDVCLTYNSDIPAAMEIMAETIKSHPLFVDPRTETEIADKKPAVSVMVRELSDLGICLRASVWTKTVSDNFTACSEIRLELIKLFGEAGIRFAHTTPRIVKEEAVIINKSEEEE